VRGLLGYQRIDLGAMVLVAGRTLVSLRPSQPGKTGNNFVHRRPGLHHRHNVMDPDTGSLQNGAPRADAGPPDVAAIARRNHGGTVFSREVEFKPGATWPVENFSHSIARSSRPASDYFPPVIYAASFSSVSRENADLCEHLASHGYLVMTRPSVKKQMRIRSVEALLTGWPLARKLAIFLAMSKTVNVAEFKDRFSELLALVEQGAEVIVCRRNVPLARVEPIRKPVPHKAHQSVLGCMKGTVRIKGDLTDPCIPENDWAMLK